MGEYEAFKRLGDLCLSLAFFIVSLPFMALIFILIWIFDGNPVIFKQVRLGKNMKPFIFYKFRTMRKDVDPRIHEEYIKKLLSGKDEKNEEGFYKASYSQSDYTKIGKILRKLSLDELPQLWNVLKGDMSLIGPRPAIPYEVKYYPDKKYFERFKVFQGLTGYWQIYKRSSGGMLEMLEMDVKYAKKQSAAFDFVIFFKTLFHILKHKGA